MSMIRRLVNLLRRERVDAEIEAELRSHIELRTADNVAAGMSPGEARRTARLRFGNPLAMRERTAGADGALWIETIWRDVRLALRQLRRSPAFTATAVLTLALGIGATTAIFTLVQQVMFRSLPVAKPDQLWRVGDAVECCFANGYTQGDDNGVPQNDWNLFSWDGYKFFRANTPAFEDLAAFEIGEGNAELGVRRAGSRAPVEERDGEYVSGNFFRTFGISPWRGRLFTDADDRKGSPPVAVMSFHTWQGKYGSDPSVVGATYEINGRPFTVIGVAPPGFFGAKIADSGMPDLWLPLTKEPLIAGPMSRLDNPRLGWLDMIGRVRPGTSPKILQAQLQVELHDWLASHVADMTLQEKALWEKQTLHVTPGGAGVSLMRQNYEGSLWLLLMAALCVLLVACANIANLLLARGLKDRRETAVRAALGASRGRLVRKALAESVTLSAFGAIAGIAVAYAGAGLILHLAISGPDHFVPVSSKPSIAVLLFALGLSVITGVVFGIAPAWMASRAEPIDALRGLGRSVGRERGFFNTAGAQKTLVIAQAAVSVVLLSAAALLGQSLRNREQHNFGFNTSGRYLVGIDPKISGYKQEQLVSLYRDIEDRLRAIPGVRATGAVLEAPLSGWVWGHDIDIEGKRDDSGPSGWTRVTPGFFETYGDKVVMGRSITDEDDSDTRPVAVVNEAFAKKFFGGENPIGQHFGPLPEKNTGMYEIVGVASDIDFGDGPEPMYFLPEAQSTAFVEPEAEEREVWSHYLYGVAIWAPGNPPRIEMEAKRIVANVDPNLIVYGVQSYADVVRNDFAQQNMIATLTWLFGAVALVLAAVGLYGVTAYGVEQRTNEIGVRMALGADRGSVVAMVLRRAFGQVAIGLALGIPAAIATGRLIASQLFGVKPWDLMTLSAATLLLALAAFAAAAIPALRAASVDPMQALRNE
jgi:putative ABC transport system permease protein